ncbi:hypothetical protein [Chryseobacterium fluminis]|uniref:hypothetical protein n=1 Tax=Chryseobacterium fluminis TaxID=2983606 RepID=UPI002B1CBC63
MNKPLSRGMSPLPTMKLNPDIKDISSFDFEDFTLETNIFINNNKWMTKARAQDAFSL